MRCLLVVLFLGICHNILASALQGNSAIYDLESRLLKLESRQFSESQSLEHRMLQMEVQLGTQQGGENYVPKFQTLDGEIATQNPPSDDLRLVDRLEKLENKWEKDLEEQLTKFSSKYDNLAERFSAIEKQVKKKQENAKANEVIERVLKTYPKSDGDTSFLGSLAKFQKIGAKYYLIVEDETLSWKRALVKCSSMNANLVSLQNEEEWSAIKDHLDSDKSYWIDITDRFLEGHYMSESTGEPAPFLKWEAREPNHLTSENGSEDCVELRRDYNHYMNDLHCKAENYYICQMKFPF